VIVSSWYRSVSSRRTLSASPTSFGLQRIEHQGENNQVNTIACCNESFLIFIFYICNSDPLSSKRDSRTQRNIGARSCTVTFSCYYSTPASSLTPTPRAHPLSSRFRRFIHSHNCHFLSSWQETIPGYWTSFDSLPYLPAGCGATLGAFVLPPLDSNPLNSPRIPSTTYFALNLSSNINRILVIRRAYALLPGMTFPSPAPASR
jgi:hypothetical protein